LYRKIAPLLAEIIRQGIQEGVMTATYPDQVGEVIASLAQDAGENIGALLLSFDPERVLGVPAGSLTLVDDQTLKEWFASPISKEVEVKS